MGGIKSKLGSMLHFSANVGNSTHAASRKQARNAGEKTPPVTTSTDRSASDREILKNKSKKERALAFLRIGNKRAAPKATGLHVEYAMRGLNAKMFEDSILDSIQINDSRSWPDRVKNMADARARLQMLGPEHIYNPEIPGKEQVDLGKIFHNIALDVQAQQAEIDKVISGRIQELQSKIEQIQAGKKTASSEAAVQEVLFSYNKDFKELEQAKKSLSDIGKQAGKLADMASICEVLRGLARRMQKLDSRQHAIDDSNVKERLAQLRGAKESKAKSISEIMSNRNLESDEQQKELTALNRKHESMAGMRGNFWMNKLAEQRAEQTEVADQIVDLFSKAADEGIDLSKELSADETIYLTRAMGLAKGRHEERGLVAGDEKEAVLINEKGGGKKTVKEREVSRQGTDKLVRQTADLLHEPQLQRLLTHLSDQETRLNEAIKYLDSSRSDSATKVRERTEEVLGALRRIDPAEVSRSRNHSETKKEMATTHIANELNGVWRRAETLRNLILSTLESPEVNLFTHEDKRQLEQAAKLLEHVKSGVDAL